MLAPLHVLPVERISVDVPMERESVFQACHSKTDVSPSVKGVWWPSVTAMI